MSSNNFAFDQHLVKYIANIARIPISESETDELMQAFNETLDIINVLNELNLNETEPTYHTTGLINVLRPDRVDKDNMFTQDQALANAKHTYEGYFVVPQVIKNKKA